MAAHRGRRRAHHEEGEHENEERWLLTYADMITLLLALFMVLYAISSVNTTKLEVLSKSLQEAFSGKVLPGGSATMDSGSSEQTEKPQPTPPLPAMMPLEQAAGQQSSSNATAAAQAEQAAKEQEDFRKLKRRIDAIVEREGLKGRVQTEIRRRGLVVRLLTDRVFFDSGRAELKARSRDVLDSLGGVLAGEREHPIVVEGYTDSQPVQRGGQYPTNWELSGARAASVVRAFVGSGVLMSRLSLAGFAQQHPVSSNATPAGRSRNRRVEVILTRQHSPSGSQP
jgi:chemotaxis protein MotB